MFSIFKGNFKIEKGYRIAGAELGMYPRNMFDQMPEAVKSQMRMALRTMIEDMHLNDHEVAVILVSPYIGAIADVSRKNHVIEKVKSWGMTRLVRPEIMDHFLTESEMTGDQWIDEAFHGPRIES